MTAFEKRLARSNARYALFSRIDLLRGSGRGQRRRAEMMMPARGRRLGVSGAPWSGGASLAVIPPPASEIRMVPVTARSRHGSVEEPARQGRVRREEARSLWLQLLHAHNLILREVRRGFQDAATCPQFDVLVHLDRAPDGLTLADLSRRLLVTAGNLTGIVGRLERDRLVRREGDPLDGRAFRVRLTIRGRNHVRRLLPRHTRLVSDLLGGLSRRDQESLRELLTRLRQDLERRPR